MFLAGAAALLAPASGLYLTEAKVGAAGRIEAKRGTVMSNIIVDKAAAKHPAILDVRLPADRSFQQLKADVVNKLANLARSTGPAATAANEMKAILEAMKTPQHLVQLLEEHYFKHHKRYFGQFRLARVALHPLIMQIQMAQTSKEAQAQTYFVRKQAIEPDPLLVAWTFRDLGQAVWANGELARRAAGYLQNICSESQVEDRYGRHPATSEYVNRDELRALERNAWNYEADDGTVPKGLATSANLLRDIMVGPGGDDAKGLICTLEKRAAASVGNSELQDPIYDYTFMVAVLLGTTGANMCKPARDVASKTLDEYLNSKSWIGGSTKTCAQFQAVSQHMLCQTAGAGVEDDGREAALRIVARHAKGNRDCPVVGHCWLACIAGDGSPLPGTSKSCRQNAMDVTEVVRTKIEDSAELLRQIAAAGTQAGPAYHIPEAHGLHVKERPLSKLGTNDRRIFKHSLAEEGAALVQQEEPAAAEPSEKPLGAQG